MPVGSMNRKVSSTVLATRLRDAIGRLNRRLRQTRPLSELTQTQLSALTSLDLAGALTPRELAEAERVRPPTMTRIVAKLEERGLIGRSPHPTDGRQVILAATAAGRAVLAAHRRARDAWLAQRLAGLSADERDTVARAIEIIERMSRSPKRRRTTEGGNG